MNVSLISLPITEGDPKANLKKMESLFHDALKHNPDLICFPEMSVVNDGYPWGQFRHLAEPVPGKFSDIFCKWAKTHQVHIAVGLLEPALDKFYSSAILVDPTGKILLKHRQVKNGAPYTCGDTFNIIQTTFGTAILALCADVWTQELISCITKYKPQYVIVPTDMSGEANELGLINFDRPPDLLAELKERYMKLSKLTDSKVLVVNCYLKDGPEYGGSFGGAFAFDNGTELRPADLQANQWRQPIDQPIYTYTL